jgi:predicted dehydrogenase
MTERLRAAVVGAGAIGASLDAGGSETPLTHAGGYVAAGCDLRALVDVSDSLGAEAAKWGAAAYRDFGAMMKEVRPEIISFAVPASVRATLMLQALEHHCVKTVIAEKPLAASLDEAIALVAAYQAKQVPLIVNYSRRFVPAWQGLIGTSAISATIRYAKGIKHNGTHAIDLCRMLFGECQSQSALSGKTDFWSDDPTVTAFLSFERCPEVILQGLDERCFTLFEADIIGPDYRVIVDQDGRRIRRFGLHLEAGIPPGRRLLQESEQDTGAGMAMRNLMQHALAVCQGERPFCSGEDAIASLQIATHLSEDYRQSF